MFPKSMLATVAALTLFCVHVHVCAAERTGKMYTVVEGSHTWNEAKAICESLGLYLPMLESHREIRAFRTYLQEWVEDREIISAVWIGLFDATYTAPDYSLYWQQTCSPLTPGYLPWATKETNVVGLNHCVIMSLDGLLRGERCERNYSVICEENNVPCWFEEYRNTQVIGLTLNDTLMKGRDSCLTDCEALYSDTEECVAANYLIFVCRLYVANDVFLDDIPSGVLNTSYLNHVTHIKRCFEDNSHISTLAVHNQSPYPHDVCSDQLTLEPTSSTLGEDTTTAEVSITADDVDATTLGYNTTAVEIPVTTDDVVATTLGDDTTAVEVPVTTEDATGTTDNSILITDSSTTTDTTNNEVRTTVASDPTSCVYEVTTTSEVFFGTTPVEASATLDISTIGTPVESTSYDNKTTISEATSNNNLISTISPTDTTRLPFDCGYQGFINSSEEMCFVHCFQGSSESNWSKVLIDLHLKKTLLSSYRRTKVSIPDTRVSASSLGVSGILLIVFVVGFICFMDVDRVILQNPVRA